MNWYKLSISPRICDDCGKNLARAGEYYMVKDSVWEEAGMENGSGDLCISCLEDRLGRELDKSDFPKMNADLSKKVRASADFSIKCHQCGWSWLNSETEPHDRYICHKCGFDNKHLEGNK